MTCSGMARRAGPPQAISTLFGRAWHGVTLLLLVCLALLAGCGGGGGGDSTPAPAAVLPVVGTQPAAQSVDAGQSASFSVVLSAGTEPVRYQWLRGGTAIAGATNASYTVAATTLADSGARFQVQISNAAGTTNSTDALLTVRPPPVAPALQTAPQAVTVNEGQSASFTVVATSNAGELRYQWLRGTDAIAGATAASYTIAAASPADNGALFSVQVSNNVGTVQTPGVALGVVVLPRISAQPTPAALVVGQTASFTVAATGTGPLQYQWQRNGSPVAGATAASVTTPTLTLADNGSEWRVVVSNAAGTVTSAAALLSVRQPDVAPAITAQPADVAVLSGRQARFTVAATGTAPLAYQWLRNGSAIDGATQASYDTPTLPFTDNGVVYAVRVTNAAGSATSRDALLRVTPRAVQVSAGGSTASARMEDGTVRTWGWRDFTGGGLRSDASNRAALNITAINTNGTRLDTLVQVSTGSSHTVGLKADGTVWSFGDNFYGQMGTGFKDGTQGGQLFPLPVRDTSGNVLGNWVEVSGGWSHTLARRSDGTVWGWGYALSSRLGNNYDSNNLALPVQYPNPVQTLGPGLVPLSGIAQIAAREGTNMAKAADGTVWIWGNGSRGRLGDGARNTGASVAQRLTDSFGVPIANVARVAVGYDVGFVLLGNGTALCWGANDYGQCPSGGPGERLWPTQVKDAAGNAFGGISDIAAGQEATAFLRTDGTVWMAGRNSNGVLADASLTLSAVPVQVRLADGTPLTGVVQIALFDRTVLVLRNDGSLWGWGVTTWGQLGVTNAPGGFVATPVRLGYGD
jgi:Regulator of chromosome condensation (RCC1) repeat/Immunoglobulin I-set domain